MARPRAPDASRAYPEIRAARRQFKRRKLSRAAALLSASRQPPWSLRSFYLDLLAETAPLPVLDAWCRHDPTSPDAWLLRGVRRIYWAWEARGSDRASTVSEDMWQVFFQRLHAAESDLLWAAELLPEDPEPYGQRISIAMGLGREPDEILACLRAATERDPESYCAYRKAVYALTEKWCGSHETMFELAREAARRATPDNDLALVLITAHLERWLYYRSFDQDAEGARQYLRDRDVRREVGLLYDRTMKPSRLRKSSQPAWNIAAFWFYLTHDRHRLAFCLERIGDAFTETPWLFAGDPAEAIAAARKMVGK